MRDLPTNAILLLSILASAPLHGYGLGKAAARRTGGDVRLGATTLYRLINQLLDRGLIEEADSRPVAELDDERRRYYRITAAGRRTLASEIARLARIVEAAEAGLRGPRRARA